MVDVSLVIMALIVAALASMMVVLRNPISCALALVMVMIGLGGIFALVGAHFVAAIQLIVYAGAIMVLFIFCIMLLNMSREQSAEPFAKGRIAAAGLASAGLFGILSWAVMSWHDESRRPAMGDLTPDRLIELGGNVVVLAASLFSEYFIPFEVMSLVLTAAIIAALIVAKRQVD